MTKGCWILCLFNCKWKDVKPGRSQWFVEQVFPKSTHNQKCWNDETWDDFFLLRNLHWKSCFKITGLFFGRSKWRDFFKSWSWWMLKLKLRVLMPWCSLFVALFMSFSMPKLGCSIMIEFYPKKMHPMSTEKTGLQKVQFILVLLKKGGSVIISFWFPSKNPFIP